MSGDGEWCSKHALSKGSGRATNELVGNPGEMPTKKPKTVGGALGTKGRNPMSSSSIKRKRGNHEKGRNEKGEKSKKELRTK